MFDKVTSTVSGGKDDSALLPFLGMIRRHWAAMALGGLLALLATFSVIGLLSLSGWFIAATAYAGLNVAAAKAFNFFLPSIGVRLFAMTRTAARYGERVICHDATFRILETLRTWCYTRLEPLTPAPLGRHHSGDLLTRITTDIDTLDNLYLRVLSPTAVAAVVVASLVGFMACYHPPMALFSGAFFIMAGAGIPFIADRAARTRARQLNEHTAQLRTVLVDGIHGLAALLTCGAAARFLDQVQLQHQALVQCQLKMSQVAGLSKALMGLASGLAVVGILVLGTQAADSGTLTGPHLAMLILAVMAGFEALAPLANAYQYLGQTRQAAHRLRQVTRLQPAVIFPDTCRTAPIAGELAFNQVCFRFPGTNHTALQNVSFKIQPGQRTAIMGATGAGKSTLLYLLARFEDPSHGEIRLDGNLLPSLSEETLRSSICIVDQRAHIFNGTLMDNLLLANPQAEEARIMEALVCVRLVDFLRTLPDGLQTWVGEAGRLLSGGQARRLAVARALLCDSPVWALDEPTEGLDSETAEAMMLNLLQHGRDKTILMVTHRAEAIDKMDQVVLLRKGCIVAAGPPHSLKRESELFCSLISA